MEINEDLVDQAILVSVILISCTLGAQSMLGIRIFLMVSAFSEVEVEVPYAFCLDTFNPFLNK